MSWEEMVSHAALGVAGEAGEVAELVKKEFYQGDKIVPDDPDSLFVAKMRHECGDLMFYITMMAVALDLDLGDIAQANVDKLLARYPKGWSRKAFEERKDLAAPAGTVDFGSCQDDDEDEEFDEEYSKAERGL
jgi:NTP pyrophosphatase (non-canonical NTP hydrolase)